MRAMGLVGSITHGVLKVHQKIYEGSNGRLGHNMVGVPTLLLRTMGRKSGKERTNALVYAKDGDRYLLVASKGGSDSAPGWLHNLRAKPEVEIQIGRDRRPATAAVIKAGDPDFERVWKLVNDKNKHRYDGYQKQTTRKIPVVAVTPAG